MNMITLKTPVHPGVTILTNLFIDNYMPKANGEFVKVYIYLLRTISDTPAAFSLEQMADHLLCTEGDILRAFRYWSSLGLLSLDFTDGKSLSSVSLLDPARAVPAEASVQTQKEASTEKSQSSRTTVGGLNASLTPERITELKQNEEIVQLLYIAEQYLGKTLSPTEIQKLLFFYDGLSMPPDLIEYLIEYCVGHGHKSIRYIEKVALSWAGEGITTVEEAKNSVSGYDKNYYAILKSMGITNRSPVKTETDLMDTWINTYGFSMEVIREACSRTVLATGQASFQYADKILSGWKNKGVKNTEDIRALDAEHQKRKKATRTPRQAEHTNRFNNFQQREYDFSEYEKRLLNR